MEKIIVDSLQPIITSAKMYNELVLWTDIKIQALE